MIAAIQQLEPLLVDATPMEGMSVLDKSGDDLQERANTLYKELMNTFESMIQIIENTRMTVHTAIDAYLHTARSMNVTSHNVAADTLTACEDEFEHILRAEQEEYVSFLILTRLR